MIMTSPFLLKSQSKSSPGRTETLSWIKEKLETYTYYTSNIKIERRISFDNINQTMIIEELNYYAPSGKKRISVEIPLSKLNSSSISIDKGTEKWVVFHVILRTNNGTNDIKHTIYDYITGEEYQVQSSDVKIFVTTDALLDNIDTRLKDAFSHAIRLSGGTTKEIF